MDFRIDAAHTGSQRTSFINRVLARKWSHVLNGSVSYPVVADGRIFVTVSPTGGHGSALYALNEQTGAIIWGPVDLGGTFGFSGATYDQQRVFAINSDGLLRALDAGTGAVKWSTRLPRQYMFTSPPTAANGLVFTGGAGSGGTLYAVSETSGVVAWTASVMNGDSSSPAVDGTDVFVSYACVQAYAFGSVDGSPVWHHQGPCEGGGGSTPSVYRGKVYARDNPTNLVLDSGTGEELGSFTATAPPAFAGNTGFFLEDGTLRARDLTSGAAIWSFAGDGNLVAAPIVVNRTVFTASGTGTVYAIDTTAGAVVATIDLGVPIAATDEHNAVQRTGIAVGDGLLLVPAGNSLFAY